MDYLQGDALYLSLPFLAKSIRPHHFIVLNKFPDKDDYLVLVHLTTSELTERIYNSKSPKHIIKVDKIECSFLTAPSSYIDCSAIRKLPKDSKHLLDSVKSGNVPSELVTKIKNGLISCITFPQSKIEDFLKYF